MAKWHLWIERAKDESRPEDMYSLEESIVLDDKTCSALMSVLCDRHKLEQAGDRAEQSRDRNKVRVWIQRMEDET
jgi:hypothetical protein